MISKRPRCFLDIEIGNEYVGRIIVELFADVCPITCENFRLLCSGEKGIGKTTKKPLHYKGSGFHRIVKNFVIQGGDFVFGDGRGGESVYGGQFKDENFIIPHDQPFILSMANKGKDSNGSQFFITTQAAPHLDGKHTVFGKVVTGTEVVTVIENVETDSSCRPMRDVKITNSGEMVLQVKAKEKKKKRSASSSDSDSDDVKSKSRKKRKHAKKHKRDRKEHKRLSADRESEEEDKCLIDPEEIPSVPTNRFLLRNTSPVTDERRNFNRSRESYSYSRKPQRSKSGRKIKGRGFMRYRTPSPTGSRSGSETPPHWKQAQSRLRKMPLPTKESTPEESQAQEAFEQAEDEEMAIQNSLLPSRLGIISKTPERAFEGSRKNSSSERKRKSSADIQFLERYSSNREQFQTSPLRSKIVVKPSRENKDENSERKFVKDAEIKGRKEFISERKKSFTNQSERSTNFQKHVINESHVSRNKITKKPEKSAEEVANEKKRFRSLKLDLFRYTNYDDDSEDEDDTPRNKTVAKDKSVEKEKKTEGNKDNLTSNPLTSEKPDEDFKLSKSGSDSPKLQTEKNSLECQIQHEPETVMSLDVKLQDHAKPLVEKLDEYHDNNKYSVKMSDSRISSNDVSAEKMLNGNPDMLCTHVKSDADDNLASVALNAVVIETQPKTPNVESLLAMIPKSPVQSIENFHVKPSTNEDTLSGIKVEKEMHEEHPKSEENLALSKSKQSDHGKQVKPSTPEGSPPRKSTSPVKQYARSSRSSSSSSPSRKRKMPKSPSDKVEPSSEKSRASVGHRSKSPVYKPSTSSSHRTGRSTESRRSKSRSRSRSGRRSSSPRSRNRRRTSRSPDNQVRRSRSRPRNERGSRFHQYQGMRHYTPPRRGNYYRPYTKSPSYRGRIKSNAHRSRSRSRSLSRRRRRQRRSTSSSASSSKHSSSSDSDARKNKSRKVKKKKRSSSSSSTGSSDSRSDSD